MSVKEKYAKLSEKVEAITLRERVIIVATIVIGVFFLWLQFVFDPLDKREKASTQLARESESKMFDLSSEQTLLADKIKQDPNIILRKQQKQLMSQIEQQRIQLEEKLEGLIAPSKMADVLKNILQATGGLKLVSAKNLPVSRFNEENEDSEESEEMPLYRHELELVIQGGYYDVIDFLLQLEGLEKGFQWVMMNYQVERYPKAEVTLLVQTLSLDEQWIGI